MKFAQKTIILSLVIIFITSYKIAEPSFAQPSDTVAITNNSRPKLSFTQLLLMFTGFKSKWPNGDKVKILINKNTTIKEKFFSEVLKMTPNKFYNVWQKKQSREGGTLPREMSSAKIKALVAGNPKYIGFILRSELDSSVNPVE